MSLEAFALAAILAHAKPETVSQYAAPGHAETVDEVRARFASIASDAAVVAHEKPLYAGARGDERTVATLLALAFHESGYAHDVDVGPCYRGRDGKSLRCDSGRAACSLQVRTDVHREHTAAELFADRKLCFREGLRVLRSSMATCARSAPTDLFAAYAGGSCSAPLAVKRGRELRALAKAFGA